MNKCSDRHLQLQQYFYIYQAFDDVVNGTVDLNDYFDAKIAGTLKKTIFEKIKPKQIIVAGDLTLNLWEENGVEIVKDALMSIKEYPNAKISYLGGGKYRILVTGSEYKSLEKILKDSSDKIINVIKKHKGKAEYNRVKNISAEAES